MTGLYSSLRFENRVTSGIVSEVLSELNATGAETGGILLGRRAADEILIEDFEPVLCQHRFGPSFQLSDEDLEGLQESLDWFRNSQDGGLEVIGLYRSQTGGDESAGARDLELMRRFFPGDESFLLLLHPGSAETVSAELLAFTGSALESLAGPMPFEAELGPTMLLRRLPAVDEAEQPRAPEPSSPDERRLLVPPDPAEIEAEQAAAAAVPPEPITEQPPLAAAAGQETRPAEQRVLLVPAAHPRRLDTEEPRQRSLWWIAAVGALTIIGAILGYRSVGVKSTPDPVKTQPAAPAVGSVPTTPAPTPVSIPRPSPMGAPAAATDSMEEEIRAAVGQWISALRSGNPARIADCYAPQLDQYFRERNASVAQVRETVARSISRYGKPAILRISEMKIFPLSQDRAVTSFRKHWQTAGPRVFAGEEHERLTFVRFRNSWKIASEEETRVYWSQRPR